MEKNIEIFHIFLFYSFLNSIDLDDLKMLKEEFKLPNIENDLNEIYSNVLEEKEMILKKQLEKQRKKEQKAKEKELQEIKEKELQEIKNKELQEIKNKEIEDNEKKMKVEIEIKVLNYKIYLKYLKKLLKKQ